MTELRRIGAYLRAVLRHWGILIIDLGLVLVDLYERYTGTWIIPSRSAKISIGLGALACAQYLAYRDLQIKRTADLADAERQKDVGGRLIQTRGRGRLSNEKNKYDVTLALEVRETHVDERAMPIGRTIVNIRLVPGYVIKNDTYTLEYTFDGRSHTEMVRVQDGIMYAA